jgi:hypothetical protein
VSRPGFCEQNSTLEEVIWELLADRFKELQRVASPNLIDRYVKPNTLHLTLQHIHTSLNDIQVPNVVQRTHTANKLKLLQDYLQHTHLHLA